MGNVDCAECRIPHPEQDFENVRLLGSDLDFLQKICDDQGPLLGGRFADLAAVARDGIELRDDEEGQDLTFYLVARHALPALLASYRVLLNELDQVDHTNPVQEAA